MQLVAERPSTGTIQAQMNYIVDTGTPPVRYIDWPEMEHKEILPQYKQHVMTIRDGRPLRDTFKLDTHGFVFADHHTAMQDFTDEAERKRVYDREVAELIKKHSGASEVLVFDHTIRIGDEQAMKAINARPPVKGVHNDYTETSAPRRLREIVGDAEAERRFKKRWAIIQVWRPIRGTVMIDPLGICDGRTIPQTGFILVQRRYKDRTGEVYHIAYNPAHEWFYFPQMKRHEAMVFKVFDTDQTVPTKFTAHSAFDDPNTPHGTRRRARASRHGPSRSGIKRYNDARSARARQGRRRSRRRDWPLMAVSARVADCRDTISTPRPDNRCAAWPPAAPAPAGEARHMAGAAAPLRGDLGASLDQRGIDRLIAALGRQTGEML